jgi:DNA-binding transcriptional LysR family regulator
MDRYLAIETFIRVVELKSFTAAADALEMSRTMASKHVADLEGRLGIRLLNRTTRTLSLTEAGQEYFDRTKAGLAMLDEATAVAANLAVAPTGRLRLNVPMSFGIRHVAPALSDFLRAHPQIKVDLTLNDRLVDLVDEGYDMALRIGRLRDSTLVARQLAPCRMIVAASPAYLASHGTPQHPDDLSQHACLAYTYWSDRDTWRFSKGDQSSDVTISGPLVSNNGDSLATAAIQDAGVILQPSFMISDALRDGRLQQLLRDWTATELGVFAVFPPGRSVTLKAKAFTDFLATRFRKVPYWDRDLS